MINPYAYTFMIATRTERTERNELRRTPRLLSAPPRPSRLRQLIGAMRAKA